MHADARMDSQTAKVNVILFLGKMNSLVSFPFIFAFSSLSPRDFFSQLGPDPSFFHVHGPNIIQ